jgi:hypothetical protein
LIEDRSNLIEDRSNLIEDRSNGENSETNETKINTKTNANFIVDNQDQLFDSSTESFNEHSNIKDSDSSFYSKVKSDLNQQESTAFLETSTTHNLSSNQINATIENNENFEIMEPEEKADEIKLENSIYDDTLDYFDAFSTIVPEDYLTNSSKNNLSNQTGLLEIVNLVIENVFNPNSVDNPLNDDIEKKRTLGNSKLKLKIDSKNNMIKLPKYLDLSDYEYCKLFLL